MGYTSPDYSNDEFHSLLAEIKKYAELDLDQWVAWRLSTERGDVGDK